MPRVNITITEEQHRLWTEMAERKRWTLPQWMRIRLDEAAEREETEKPAPKKKP